MSSLAELNRGFECNEADLPVEVWNEWLWGCDLAEPTSVDCPLNRSHLLGLLIARYRAAREPDLMEVCVELPNVAYQHSSVGQLTPRQLKDLVEDLQLHWAQYSEKVECYTLAELVNACMTRLGACNLQPTHYEDVGMRDAVCADRMSAQCIRRLVSIFCVLYRHLDLMYRCKAPAADCEALDIQDFHVQSSMDEFHTHSMHSDLPPAARLIYRQDFSGFYHCVSQVVFFHFPDYARGAQLSLDAIRSGESAVHTLAPVLTMYPEINLCYEDETPRHGAWNWILMGKRVYLMEPTAMEVYHSPNLLKLMGQFLTQSRLNRERQNGSATME